MSTTHLNKAHALQDDEFYTKMEDIEKEIDNYKDYLRGKSIYCNCDNPKHSNFFRYFRDNFNKLGLNKLVATYYQAIESMVTEVTQYGSTSTTLKGNGDFRSNECIDILRYCDIVITNPPFSLLKEFIPIMLRESKNFIIIGPPTLIARKYIFSYMQELRMWGGHNAVSNFIRPDGTIKKANGVWYTNLGHPPNNNLPLKEIYVDNKYDTYDNYDAINVNKIADIPKDYTGEIGVPITFMLKYNPDQFDIIGLDTILTQERDGKNSFLYINKRMLYSRIIIKLKDAM